MAEPEYLAIKLPPLEITSSAFEKIVVAAFNKDRPSSTSIVFKELSLVIPSNKTEVNPNGITTPPNSYAILSNVVKSCINI